MGAHTVVGEHVQLCGASTLGRHCRVMDRTVIVDSHLWDGCIVETGAVVQQSMLGAGAVVRDAVVWPDAKVAAGETVECRIVTG